MEISKEKMIFYMRQAAQLEIKRIFMAEEKPLPAGKAFFVNRQKSPRFIMPLCRSKRVRFSRNGTVRDIIINPGEVLFCPSWCWSTEVWDRQHEMISIVFQERYIRTLFISHNGLPPDQDGPDILYHTLSPLTTAGNHLLHAVQTAGEDTASRLLCLRALLVHVIECVENDSQSLSGKESYTWDCIQDYLETNFYLNISRTSMAETLRLHPATLSRLVKKVTGMGVNEYLSKLRMEHAKRLLEENVFTIDEIADQCGYTYTSYFIRKFREYYSDSPFRYREKFRRENNRYKEE